MREILRDLLPELALLWGVLFGSAGLVFGAAYLTRPTRHEAEHWRYQVPPQDRIPPQQIPTTEGK